MMHEKNALSQPAKRNIKKSKTRSLTQVPSTSAQASDDEKSDNVDEVMDECEENELSAVVIQYLLMAQKNKRLVKISDLKKFFPKTFSKKVVQEILDKAFDEMMEIFGIEVCVVTSEKGTQVIVLKNNFAETLSSISGYSLDDKNNIVTVKRAILLATLMYLFMAKNPKVPSSVVTETALFDFLESLGLNSLSQIDLKKLIEPKPSAEFISEGWINYEKDSTKFGVETVLYSWGARAKVCIDRKKLLELFCEIDGSKPEDWSDHMAELVTSS